MTTATEATAPVRATGIDAIFFSVTDVPRATRFYRELLDIREVTFEGDHGAEYVLADGNAFGFGSYSSGEWRPSGCVLFAVADVEAASARIASIGGKLEGEIKTFPNCRSIWCQDPDGNSFVLHERTS